MKPVFEYTKGMRETELHYCPGCTHGIAHRLIMEVLEERGDLGNCIAVSPVGCSIVAHQYMNVDMMESPHGRAPAVASGIKRVHPNSPVFTYQGDGDLASITLIGQKTTTCVDGRTIEQAGMPMRMCELISCQDRAVYVERVSLDSPANVRKAKSAIRRAFKVQDLKLGFAFVEFLSICPTNWGLTAPKAMEWLRENMMPYYPVKQFKCPEEVKEVK